MFTTNNKARNLSVLIIMAVIFTSATAVLAHGGDLALIHACVNNSSGTIKIVGANDTCENNWTALDWNIQGLAGPQGPAGADGATGPQGPAGADGADGATGPAGADGATGPAGPAGPQGEAGPQGATGPAGADGATGPAGPAGPVGAPGIQGLAGPVGAPGIQGLAGPVGAPGIQGLAGPVGAPGPQGQAGPVGDTGPQGAPGISGYEIVIGKTVEGGGSRYRATVTCPAGKKVLGGGGTQRDFGYYLDDSAPLTDGSGWYVEYSPDTDGPHGPGSGEAWAICAFVQ